MDESQRKALSDIGKLGGAARVKKMRANGTLSKANQAAVNIRWERVRAEKHRLAKLARQNTKRLVQK